MIKKKIIKIVLSLICIILISCKNNNLISDPINNSKNDIDENIINVRFELGKDKEYDNNIVEDTEKLKSEGREHSIKYYSYLPTVKKENHNYKYYDVAKNERYMKINDNVDKNNYIWEENVGVFSKKPPIGYKMSYGLDISKHNGDIDFNKVKAAGFDFVFIRIVYRGYGKTGNLKVDEMQEVNFKKAREAGLKVGAYVFSQSINQEEAIEEAKKAIELLKNYKLDLPLVYDIETIKNDIARTDDINGKQFTENALAFCQEIKNAGFEPAIYSNMVWEDYYFDMEKFKDIDIWYADYSKIPQTPYNFKYWQFSETGIVDGVNGLVDLNVMIEY